MILKGLREVYAPIRAYIYLAHTLRAKLLRKAMDIFLDGPEFIIGDWYQQLMITNPNTLFADNEFVDTDWKSMNSSLESSGNGVRKRKYKRRGTNQHGNDSIIWKNTHQKTVHHS